MTNTFPGYDFCRHREVLPKIPGEQALTHVTSGLTGNAGVTLTAVMTRKPKPPIAIYSALADATRCRIIEILLAGPIPVHTLSDAFAISRPAISRHLRVLKTAGLVAEVKKGRENLYALRTAKMGAAVAWIETLASSSAPATATPVIEIAAESVVLRQETPKSTRSRRAPARGAKFTETTTAPSPTIALKPEKPTLTANTQSSLNQMGFDF